MIKRLSVGELQKIFYKEKERLEQLPQDGSNMYTRGTATYLLEVCDELDSRIKYLDSSPSNGLVSMMILLHVLTTQLKCSILVDKPVITSDTIVDKGLAVTNRLWREY